MEHLLGSPCPAYSSWDNLYSHVAKCLLRKSTVCPATATCLPSPVGPQDLALSVASFSNAGFVMLLGVVAQVLSSRHSGSHEAVPTTHLPTVRLCPGPILTPFPRAPSHSPTSCLCGYEAGASWELSVLCALPCHPPSLISRATHSGTQPSVSPPVLAEC